MDKKNSTKVFLAESLRALIQRMPFQSITIKKICDEAGVVRVTFYNYFVDKYDALDFLVKSDLSDGIQVHEKDPFKVLMEHLAKILVKHRRFYSIAMDIDGQNGFQEIFITQMKSALLDILKVHRHVSVQREDLSNEFLAEAYSVMIFYFVRTWLKTSGNLNESDFLNKAEKMSHCSLYDFLNQGK